MPESLSSRSLLLEAAADLAAFAALAFMAARTFAAFRGPSLTVWLLALHRLGLKVQQLAALPLLHVQPLRRQV